MAERSRGIGGEGVGWEVEVGGQSTLGADGYQLSNILTRYRPRLELMKFLSGELAGDLGND
jgi:hypothetical protein